MTQRRVNDAKASYVLIPLEHIIREFVMMFKLSDVIKYLNVMHFNRCSLYILKYWQYQGYAKKNNNMSFIFFYQLPIECFDFLML